MKKTILFCLSKPLVTYATLPTAKKQAMELVSISYPGYQLEWRKDSVKDILDNDVEVHIICYKDWRGKMVDTAFYLQEENDN